jgi:hypothetical protein
LRRVWRWGFFSFQFPVSRQQLDVLFLETGNWKLAAENYCS